MGTFVLKRKTFSSGAEAFLNNQHNLLKRVGLGVGSNDKDEKEKEFALTVDGKGKSLMDFKNEYNAAGGKAKLGVGFKDWYKGADTGLAATNKNIVAQETARIAQRNINKANPGAAATKAGFQRGANSVGIMGGLKNTFAKAGTVGKTGLIGAGVLGTGLAAKGAYDLMSGKNKNQ